MLIVSEAKNPFQNEDQIISLNGQKINDIIDLRFFAEDENLVIIERHGWNHQIEATQAAIQQLSFAQDIPNVKTCKNKCLFCFVDQLPKGLRKTLYFKDDDWRLSFLTGNFITLTNLASKDINRIINQKISPLYISVHAINKESRQKMGLVDNGDFFANLKKLDKAGIRTNLQIVLCPGLNDEAILFDTLANLEPLMGAESVGIVPVGLTKYHKRGLLPVSKNYAKELIEKIEPMQEKYLKTKGTRWLYLADEFYLRAGQDVPEDDYYEDYLQLENGIGLVRKFLIRHCEEPAGRRGNLKAIMVTGTSFEPILKKAISAAGLDKNISVQAVINNFFGKNITVTGLLSAKDIIEQVKPSLFPILIPGVTVNQDEMFLDNVSFADLKKKLPTAELVNSK